MDTKLIYITAPDIHEARSLGGMLVEQRLAACVNIIQPVESMYWWEGEVQRAEETALVVKTTGDLVPRLIDFVKAQHSYDCPCVVTLDIEAGNPDFLKWIADETHGAGADGSGKK